MSVQVGYKKQFVLGMLLLIILFGVVEGISQIIWYNMQNNCSLEKTYFENYSDDFRKKMCSDYKNLKYDVSAIRKNEPNQKLDTLSINSLGFRGPEMQFNKEPDEYRIVLVGGSTTFGMGAPSDSSTIPAYLEDMLQDKFGTKIKVINAGVIAAGSVEEAYYIKKELIQLRPDLIIVFDGYNDAFNIKLSEINENVEYEKLEKRTFIERIGKKYFSELAFPNVIYQSIHDDMQIRYLTEDVKKENTKKWINRWNEICHLGKETGFELLVTVQPMVGTSDRKLTPIEEEIHSKAKTQKIIEFLNALGESVDEIDCASADLRHTFDGVNEQVFFSAVHTGSFGNKIIAEKMYEKVLPIIMRDMRLDNY
ncbi:SGNH/GDSL hydrolase family protein [Candidatus Nitrosotenuis cloacae]|uniref:SGNH/GDSL hydrolase family protein n=1 Tax=Candidatus Nitrosotenuis cloacae TaxID=1603555 RepID=UPI00227F27F0|nr:SGNH/GDSL hydrolase family protein [Candidatus Nitrosotenuis cloacae]